jgi:AraC family transcriptional regulator of adaptative response / DNA-3-methyladenine glycosylase II
VTAAPTVLSRHAAVRAIDTRARQHVCVPRALPDPQICEQARLSRDARFDGLFFTGVLSTRIYCRPVCPARWATRVTYFTTAASAEAAGYRPCLRCRPELSPSDGAWRRSDEVVARALKLLDQGSLDDEPLTALAERVGIGERQLRRLFVERLGAPPIAVRRTRRLLFAKQLLTETRLPITQVALAAGFGSLRRFNAAFREAYRMPPSALRRHPAAACEEVLTLRLSYRPPFDFDATLEFLRHRVLPGVERVDGASYARVIPPEEGDRPRTAGWVRVSAWPNDEHALRLELHGVAPKRVLAITDHLRRMFDLDADPQGIEQALSACDVMAPLVRARPGLRIPGGWDGFEIAIRAILVARLRSGAARALAGRFMEEFGVPLPSAATVGLDRTFPTAEALMSADLSVIGVPPARARVIRAVARAVVEARADFNPERTLEEFVARWTMVPGIGERTAHYLALRALGHPDAFPAAGVRLPARAPNDEPARVAISGAEGWRPWRAYAAVHLWKQGDAR